MAAKAAFARRSPIRVSSASFGSSAERRAESLQRRVEGAASFENLARQDQRTRIRRIQLSRLLRMHEGGGKVIVLFFDSRELSIQKRALR